MFNIFKAIRYLQEDQDDISADLYLKIFLLKQEVIKIREELDFLIETLDD